MRTIKSCPMCRMSGLRYLFASRDRMYDISGSFGIHACSSCGTYILSPRPTGKELSRYYPPQKYYAYQGSRGGFFSYLRAYLVAHYYKPTPFSRLLSNIVHNVPAIPSRRPGGKVLDVGCGTGDTLLMLKHLGWDVYGMDIDSKAIEIAGKRGVTHAKVGVYQNLVDYKDNFFDVIRLYHVIEHLDDPSACIDMIYKKLKKGGELIIGTPNAASVLAKTAKAYWYNLDSPRHLYVFTPDALSRMVSRAGFAVKTPEFASAGGIAGSIGYFLTDALRRRLELVHKTWLVLLLYPVEWFLDKAGAGDVFILRAQKGSSA